MNSVLKMMNFVLKMMNFVLKMMDVCSKIRSDPQDVPLAPSGNLVLASCSFKEGAYAPTVDGFGAKVRVSPIFGTWLALLGALFWAHVWFNRGEALWRVAAQRAGGGAVSKDDDFLY